LAGVLLEDGNVVVPGGLGGAVGGQSCSVFSCGDDTGGVGGLGNLGWEVSHLSQVESNVVVSTVVEVSDRISASTLCYAGGYRDVGDVTVELVLDTGEIFTSGFCVYDWGLTWGIPSGGLLGDAVFDLRSLSVPGSEGAERRIWHGEEWGKVGWGNSISDLLEARQKSN